MPDVSVVIPTLNEEETIATCINKVKKVFKEQNIDGEIIISDSSTDRTPEIAESLGAKIVYPKKKGYGNAYIEGFAAARGTYLVMGDADDTYDFLEIPKFLELLKKNEADFVIGSRFKGEIKKGAMSWLHHYIGNPLLTKILNILFKTGFSDAHCGMRAFTKEAWEKMNLNTGGMEFASEMVIKASKKDLKIKEIPINLYPRKGTPAKLSSFKDGWRHLRFMVLYQPNVFLLYPGTLLFIFGSIFTFLLWRGPIRVGNIGLSIHPLILVSLFTLLGFQLMIFGIYTKVYRTIYRDEEPGRFTSLFLNYHSLEYEMLIGVILFIGGFLIDLRILLIWINRGFGVMPQLRNAILASTLMILGLQLVASALFISMLLLDRNKN
jgi:glycosyltransferase involved in cell wall biosynthesis